MSGKAELIFNRLEVIKVNRYKPISSSPLFTMAALTILKEIEKGTKSAQSKRRIIAYHMKHGNATIPDLAKRLGLSIPTVSKLVDELTDTGLIKEGGKTETGSGRHPNTYGLNPESCYFVGVDIKNTSVSLGLMDFGGKVIEKQLDVLFESVNSVDGLTKLCDIIERFISSRSVERTAIMAVNVNISGRVNPKMGYSYSRYNFEELPLSEVLTKKLGVRVCIENDTRAMAYGEYLYGDCSTIDNLIFLNLSWGIGLGIIIGGRMYYGKSGFAGEIGHMVTYDNEILCQCGKKGCLETEASGRALVRKLTARLEAGANSIIADRYHENKKITLEDIFEAIDSEDLLCIELVEDMGRELGRWLAGIINIFNPEKVILGGSLSSAVGDYLLQPVTTAVRRYSLNLVNKDTKIVISHLGDQSGLIGSCAAARRYAFDDYID